jgi:hypothetical protein
VVGLDEILALTKLNLRIWKTFVRSFQLTSFAVNHKTVHKVLLNESLCSLFLNCVSELAWKHTTS